MKLLWAALGLVLALGTSVPRSAAAQATQQSRDLGTGSVLGQNYPNPFDQETTIPFAIGGGTSCSDQSRQYRVSLRIYNMLAQLVSVPVLNGGTAGASGGQPLLDVVLSCGNYAAFWDGTLMGTGRHAASGVYLYRLEVDGRPIMRKMIIIR